MNDDPMIVTNIDTGDRLETTRWSLADDIADWFPSASLEVLQALELLDQRMRGVATPATQHELEHLLDIGIEVA